MNPSRLSWEIISWLSDEIFNANHLISTGYGISTLELHCWVNKILGLLPFLQKSYIGTYAYTRPGTTLVDSQI